MGNKKIKYTCENYNFATCVKYETPTPEFSSLLESNCTDVEEVLTDIYSLIGGVKEQIDVTTLENTCITFIEPKTPSSVIEQMYNKLCELENLIETKGELITTMQAQITDLQENNCP